MLRICRLDHLCVHARKVYCGKTAHGIRMPFGVMSGVGLGMGVLDGVVIVKGEEAVWGEFGCPIVTNGTFAMRSSQINLRTCCSSYGERLCLNLALATSADVQRKFGIVWLCGF